MYVTTRDTPEEIAVVVSVERPTSPDRGARLLTYLPPTLQVRHLVRLSPVPSGSVLRVDRVYLDPLRLRYTLVETKDDGTSGVGSWWVRTDRREE